MTLLGVVLGALIALIGSLGGAYLQFRRDFKMNQMNLERQKLDQLLALLVSSEDYLDEVRHNYLFGDGTHHLNRDPYQELSTLASFYFPNVAIEILKPDGLFHKRMNYIDHLQAIRLARFRNATGTTLAYPSKSELESVGVHYESYAKAKTKVTQAAQTRLWELNQAPEPLTDIVAQQVSATWNRLTRKWK